VESALYVPPVSDLDFEKRICLEPDITGPVCGFGIVRLLLKIINVNG